MKVSFLKCWNKWILTHTLHSPTNVNESIRRRGRGTLFLLYAWFLSFWFWWGELYFWGFFWKFLKNFINYYFISEGVQICLYMIFVLHLRTWFSAVIWWFSSYKLHVFLFNINEEDPCSLVHKHITMYIFIIKKGSYANLSNCTYLIFSFRNFKKNCITL